MDEDKRLREHLARLAGEVHPDTDERLARTLAAARRRTSVRSLRTLALDAAAVIVLLVFTLIIVTRGLPSNEPAASPPALTGSWTRTVDTVDPVVVNAGMPGKWVIGFPENQSLNVQAPPGFQQPRTGYSFQVTGDVMRTDLFGESVCSDIPAGSYRFEISGSQLSFTLVDDQCALRVTFFTGGAWSTATSQ